MHLTHKVLEQNVSVDCTYCVKPPINFLIYLSCSNWKISRTRGLKWNLFSQLTQNVTGNRATFSEQWMNQPSVWRITWWAFSRLGPADSPLRLLQSCVSGRKIWLLWATLSMWVHWDFVWNTILFVNLLIGDSYVCRVRLSFRIPMTQKCFAQFSSDSHCK